MGRTKNTGLTVSSDSPSRKELANKIDELTSKQQMIQLLVEANVKFTKEDVIFATRDQTGQIVWLEKGNANVGLEHILHGDTKSNGHIEDFKKALNLNVDKIPNYLQEVITKGKVISNEVIDLEKRKGFKRIYSYNKKYYIVTGIGENGFIVTAFPHKKGDK